MIKCGCGNDLTIEDYYRNEIHFCSECGNYKVVKKECEHEYYFVFMQLENGTLQLRKYCRNCMVLEKTIYKKADAPAGTPIKVFEKYKLFIEKHEEPFYKRLSELRIVLSETFQARYDRYINSPEWQKKRHERLAIDNYEYKICNRAATDVHHLTYTHFEHEYMFELISLCSKCHIDEYHPERKQTA